MASGYLPLTSRYWRISAVAVPSRLGPALTAADLGQGEERAAARSSHSLAAAAAGRALPLAAGLAALAALVRPALRRLIRALSFRCRVFRRIFIERRFLPFSLGAWLFEKPAGGGRGGGGVPRPRGG